MKSMFESLESRQFLSASVTTVTQDAAALKSSTKTIHADLTTWKQQSDSARKALQADLHKKGTGSSGKAVVKVYTTDEVSGFHKVSKDVQALLSVTVKDTDKIVADLVHIAKKSTAALQAKLTADIAKLNSDTAALSATTNTDVQAVNTLLQKDLTSILAISGLATDGNKAKAALASGLQTVMTDLTTIATGVTKLATDAAA